MIELTVEPADGPIDLPPHIRVDPIADRAPIALTVEVVDAAGHAWRSVSTVENGTAPDEPWWSMDFVGGRTAPTAFTAPADQLTYRLTATVNGQTATLDVVRRWKADDVTVHTTGGAGYRLKTYTPEAVGAPSVLIVPGSTGAQAVEPQAALLASKGYRAGILTYTGDPGLPSAVCRIPLEALAEGYRAFAEDRPVVVIAASVATGGVFTMLATHPDLRPAGVIGIAPTDVMWQALPFGGPPPKAAMWTLNGTDLPWLPSHGELALGQMLRHATVNRLQWHPTTKALKLRAGYTKGRAERRRRPETVIDVAAIAAPLMLLSGAADAMWPSTDMAAAIINRRHRDDDTHIDFPDAGHFLRPPITPTTVPHNNDLWSGGTPAGNAQAQKEGWQLITTFLRRHLPQVDVRAAHR